MTGLHTDARYGETRGWLSRERALILVLMAATAVALYICYRLVQPFLPALAWALALGVVGHPLHRWLARHIRRPNLAAAVAVILMAVAIVGPTLFVTQQLIQEAARGAKWLQSEGAAGRWQETLDRHPRLTSVFSWFVEQMEARRALEQLSTTLTSRLSSFVSGSAWIVAELLVTFFALFYFFRDRRPALRTLRFLVPLSEAETEEVLARIIDTIYAIIFGTLVVALVQGFLGGLMFWVLGLPAPLLWGTMMALLSVVPVLGAFIVWVPAAVFLALEGSWGKAILLTVWGAGVVSLIDNLLYPVLVGRRLRLHTLPVFIALVGGVLLFGSAGVILGPVTLAVTLALIEIWHRRTVGGRTAETGVNV
jgi:predicted PurR-regulated permease PerM